MKRRYREAAGGNDYILKLFSGSIVIAFLFFTIVSARAGETAGSPEVVPGIPVAGTVTMVDLGAGKCIPCKAMAPILEEVREEYKGRAAVIFIDVWEKENAEKAKAFKIRGIPTQIFYDRHGREVFRHSGFYGKKPIVAKLEELLNQP